MTLRAYDHYLHTGSWSAGSGSMMKNLRSVLAHCLVNGTGGVPAAGWNLEYDAGGDEGSFVLSNANRDFFICFSYVNASTANVSIAATFEGVGSDGYIIGEAARSGALPFFASATSLNSSYFLGGFNTSETGRGGWSILADEQSVAVAFSSSSSASYSGDGMDINTAGLYRYGGGFGFGKTTKGYGYFSGTGSSNYYTHPAMGVTTINYPQTGLLIPSADTVPAIAAGVLGQYNGNSGSGDGIAEYVYEDLPMHPIEAYMQGSATVSGGSLGLLRGFVQFPTVNKTLYMRHLLRAMGMSQIDFDTMRVQDISRFRQAEDSYRYAYCKVGVAETSLAPAFITDNPAVW